MSVLGAISGLIKLAHSILIVYTCHQLTHTTPNLPPTLLLTQLSLTLLSLLIAHKHHLDLLQIPLSLFLTYLLIPNKYTYLSGLYFLKIIYLYNTMGQAIEQLFDQHGSYLMKMVRLVIEGVRCTVVQFLFLGVVMVAYKVYTINDPEGTVYQDYIILYKLVVTATTIGYGDYTPKTHQQIIFFTYTIPIICASFVIYLNQLIPILSQLIDLLTYNTIQVTNSTNTNSLQSKIWSKEQRQDFNNFAEEVSRRTSQQQQFNKKMGYNWIAIAAHNYQKQIPLLNYILAGDQNKQARLKLSSKVRKLYFPPNWTIIENGDVSQDLMMVEQGQIKINSVKGKGHVFNTNVFRGHVHMPVQKSIITVSFVVVWAISLKDIQEVGRTSTKIRNIIAQITSQ